MTYLGIETSFDETGVSIVKKNSNGNLEVVSNLLASSANLHIKTGGVIPESAAREQLNYIIPLLDKSSKIVPLDKIDALCVTTGPGLIGSLLVGVETIRTISYIKKIPLIPINHLHGHIYANYLSHNHLQIKYPAIALVVSGAHTDLIYMKNEKNLKVLGATRDDAAGEAFDKIGRLLNIDYPAGAKISKLADSGNPKKLKFPRPMLKSDDFDFSFSGLKTSVLNFTKTDEFKKAKLQDICLEVEEAIIEVLETKTIKAAKKYKVKSILVGGGVSTNSKLRERLGKYKSNFDVFYPEVKYCTDNGAMIAAAGFFSKPLSWEKVKADPQLYY